MPPRRGRPRNEVGRGRSPPANPNPINPELTEAIQQAVNNIVPGAVQQALVDMMPEFIAQAVEAMMQANNSGGGGPIPTSSTPHGTPQTLHQWSEKFHKQKPRSFSSATNPIDAEHWIKHLEKIFELMECPDNIQVRLAAYKLDGDANQWWHAWKQVRGGNACVENLTWKEFKEVFLQQYFTTADRQSFIREYSTIAQKEDETVTDFVARFLRLAAFAGPLAGTEADRIERFKWALLYRYRVALRGHQFTELSQLVSVVRDVELDRRDYVAKINEDKKRKLSSSADNQSKRSSSRQKTNSGWQSRQSNSRPNQSSKVASNASTAFNYVRPTWCEKCKKMHQPGSCLQTKVTCFNCGEPGHISRDCKKERKCFICGQYGHPARDCIARQTSGLAIKDRGQTSGPGDKDKGKQPITSGRVFALSADKATDGVKDLSGHY